jgi:hypothetical protein
MIDSMPALDPDSADQTQDATQSLRAFSPISRRARRPLSQPAEAAGKRTRHRPRAPPHRRSYLRCYASGGDRRRPPAHTTSSNDIRHDVLAAFTADTPPPSPDSALIRSPHQSAEHNVTAGAVCSSSIHR